MPPSDPPTTSSTSRMSRASSNAHWAAAWSACRDRREARAVRTAAAARSDRGRARRAVAAAQEVGAEHADPVGVERSAGADERLPPVAGRIGRTREGVDDDDLWRLAGGRAVMAVRDDQLGEWRPVREFEWPERRGLEPAGPRGQRHGDSTPRRVPRGSGRRVVGTSSVTRPRRRARRRPGSRRWPSRVPGPGRRSGRRRARVPTDRRMRSARDPGRGLLLGLQLRVRGRGRVDDQRLRVADVGEEREDLDVVDEPATGLDPTLHAERRRCRRSHP